MIITKTEWSKSYSFIEWDVVKWEDWYRAILRREDWSEDRFDYFDNRNDLITHINIYMDYNTQVEVVQAWKVHNSPTLKWFYLY